MPTLTQRLFGTDEQVPPTRLLRAGPLSVHLRGARLLHIRCGAHEVWHGLAFLLRDADWGTPEPVVDRAEVRESDADFDVRIAGHWQAAAPVAFTLRIIGRIDGSLRFDAEAVPSADLPVNRLGLCLLHPVQACGARVEVTHVDGRLSTSTFPEQIPPWPPFMLVRGLRHEWTPGHWAQATLEGDVFETEDQRNNADASFKTYSRSNMAPRPYLLSAGVPLRQSALLRIETPAHAAPRPVAPLRVTVGDDGLAGPAVGVEIHADDAREPVLLDALRELQPAHLHLAWRPGLPVHWPGVASMLQAAGARLRLDVRLDVRLGGRDDAALLLQALRADLAASGIEPEALAVFPSDSAHMAAARREFPALRVGGGTPHFFVQLSRLDTLGAVDFASFTTSSVVHGADDDEVMLGLASLPAMVATWHARHPGVPLRVGPSSIAARSSPLGAQPPSDGTRRLALAATDPRSRAQFGAAWALGHVAGLARHGVQAVSLLSLRGASGLVDLDVDRFTRHPAFHVLAPLGRPSQSLDVEVSHPMRVAALAWRRGSARTLMVSNLGSEAVEVGVAGMPASSRWRCLDATCDGPSQWRPSGLVDGAVSLAPYAVALIETPGP